jgi:predicted Zn-dependent peptidase
VQNQSKRKGALGAWRLGAVLMAALVATGSLAASDATAALPKRPEDIKFKPLRFEPPDASQYKHVLANGVTVYMVQSREFPLVTVTMSFRGGEYLEPADKSGLAQMTGAMMRRGGTSSIGAQELDEQLDFLAAQVSSNIGPTRATATVNSLTSNFDEAFGLFMDIVRNPGFDQKKFEIYRAETLESMKQRNDDAATIQAIQLRRLVWGPDHFEGRYPTEQSINSITVEDMRAFHQRIFHPGNLIMGVVGDFDIPDMINKLDNAMTGWTPGEMMEDPRDTEQTINAGVYFVEKDIPQGKVTIVQRGVRRDDPDWAAIDVMNDILGGGGFTSRLMKRIRNDEGLAYGAGSGFSDRVEYPGTFQVSYASKNRTVALAAKFALEEIEKIRTTPVSEEELKTAKESFIETFPRLFESKQGMVNVFIDDQWTNRPDDYWQTYRQSISKVTAADVLRVAKERLNPSNMAMVVVGKWDEILPGDPTEQRETHKARMDEFFGGSVTQMPLLDPMTLEPMPTNN